MFFSFFTDRTQESPYNALFQIYHRIIEQTARDIKVQSLETIQISANIVSVVIKITERFPIILFSSRILKDCKKRN